MGDLFDFSMWSVVRQEIGNDPDLQRMLEIPEVVVVGSQNTGKSALLDQMFGIPIFPQADGLCTRCPIEVHSKRVPGLVEPVADLHVPNHWPELDIPAAGLKEKLEAAMHALADSDGDARAHADLIKSGAVTDAALDAKQYISTKSIVIYYRAADAPDLCLTDLPGLIIESLKGVHSGVPAAIKTLILEKIRKPNAIILMVAKANGNDLNTQPVLEPIRSVDPELSRVLGVLTHCDMANSTFRPQISAILANDKIECGHGWVGLSNMHLPVSQTGNDPTLTHRIGSEHLPSEHDAATELGPDLATRMGIPACREIVHTKLLAISDRIKSSFKERVAVALTAAIDQHSKLPAAPKRDHRLLESCVEDYERKLRVLVGMTRTDATSAKRAALTRKSDGGMPNANGAAGGEAAHNDSHAAITDVPLHNEDVTQCDAIHRAALRE